MPEESLVGVSAASAVIERSVWEKRSTTRALVAYAEWVHETTLEPGSALLTWAVEFSGQVVNSVLTQEAEKSCRTALVPFGGLVMFMPLEKPKDKGETRKRVGVLWTDLTKSSLARLRGW